MTAKDGAALVAIDRAVRKELQTSAHRPVVLGLCGAQGSGKSTLAAKLEQRFDAAGIACATLSLDDLYKTKAARGEMACDIHPLFATRGVPGTHDLDLAVATFATLDRGQGTSLPRFDKASDDRLPENRWDSAPSGLQVLIFEGWCVGARPQADADLAAPVNVLERDEDPDAVWRRDVNAALEGDYKRLFARIDLLVLLAAPGFDVVRQWRTEQERALRRIRTGGMSDAEIGCFIQYYERLTRHILIDMPTYADIVITLDADRIVREIRLRC